MAAQAGEPSRRLSFRSTEAVLQAVDAVFAEGVP
jgi:ATP-dependent exoDNAse (exonuclease V) beta subunit